MCRPIEAIHSCHCISSCSRRRQPAHPRGAPARARGGAPRATGAYHTASGQSAARPTHDHRPSTHLPSPTPRPPPPTAHLPPPSPRPTSPVATALPTDTPTPAPSPTPEPVVVNGRVYEAYIPAATKEKQAYQYSCEFDAAWVILQTYGFDAQVDELIAIVGVDESVEPYIEQTRDGFVI